MQNHTFNIEIDANRTISGDVRISQSDAQKPLAIVMHGLKGNRNWGFLPKLSEQFAELGYIAINYDHSLNGYIPGSIQYDMSKFSRITVSAQLQELDMIISAIKSGELLPDAEINNIWNGEIVLCGHSMGAAVALIYASENKIDKLIMIAPISKFDRYTERQKKQWRIDGFVEFYNPKIDQTMRIDSTFIDDMDANLERFDLLKAISKCNSKIMIAHGEQDVTVPIREAIALYDNSNKDNCILNNFPHCNHSFNLDSLGTSSNPHLSALMDCIREFAKIEI